MNREKVKAKNEQAVFETYSNWAADKDKRKLYSLFNPGELHMRQSRERITLLLLKNIGHEHIEELKILEVGCGRGHQIGEYLRWGCNPEQLSGVDIIPEFLTEACKRYPTVKFQNASVLDLPYEDNSFDAVSQSTVMSSLLDPKDRKKMAQEMNRVLRPGGIILWYDFRYHSPKNKNVKGINYAQIKDLFNNYTIHIKTTTLLPPLVRRIAPISNTLASFFEIFVPLRSHIRGVFQKPE